MGCIGVTPSDNMPVVLKRNRAKVLKELVSAKSLGTVKTSVFAPAWSIAPPLLGSMTELPSASVKEICSDDGGSPKRRR